MFLGNINAIAFLLMINNSTTQISSPYAQTITKYKCLYKTLFKKNVSLEYWDQGAVLLSGDSGSSLAMAAGLISEWNQDATMYVGGLDEKVSKPLLWGLFLQAGPVVNTHMPKDRVTGQHQGYGFV